MKINVYTKVVTSKTGNKFNTYFTKLKFEDGEKWITLKFKREVSIPKEFPCQLSITDSKDVYVPMYYKPKKNADGKLEYPVVWIRNYEGYKPIERKVLSTQKPTFVVDEEETDECEF